MKPILAICLFLLSGCPGYNPCYGDGCGVRHLRTYGVAMTVTVQPGVKKTTAEVVATINRPVSHYNRRVSDHSPSTTGERPVKQGEDAYEEEITLKLHWSCPTLEKSGEVDVVIAEDSAKGEVKISNLPPQPPLTVYPWEFKRGLECVIMTEDEKTAQEEELERKQDNSSSDDSDDEETTDEEDAEDKDEYRGQRAFFIKKSAPEVKVSQTTVVAGNPNSYIDIKVELLRDEVAVVAGDRSFDLEVEVKLPWECKGTGVTEELKSGDTHIIIPAGASSEEARLIMPAQRAVKLTCEVEANAYIDSFIIGNSSEPLEFKIPKQ